MTEENKPIQVGGTEVFAHSNEQDSNWWMKLRAPLFDMHQPLPHTFSDRYFLPEGTESFAVWHEHYEGRDELETYNGQKGVWLSTPQGLISAEHQRDGIFFTQKGIEAIPHWARQLPKFSSKPKPKESQSVKNYRSVLNGLIARTAK